MLQVRTESRARQFLQTKSDASKMLPLVNFHFLGFSYDGSRLAQLEKV